jgi:GDP-L-fucose synthase
MSNKKILVLGGHGFMGKNIKSLFDDDENYQMFYISKRDGFDFRSIEDLNKLLLQIDPDIIIFAAANVGSISYVSKNSAQVVHDNTLMYLNLYKSISEINKNIIVINPISNCSYPGVIDIQSEKDWWEGKVHESVQSYGVPKKMGFIISECYKQQYGIKTINLIIPNAYGPFDYLNEEKTHALNGIVLRMIKSQKNNKNEFSIWGSGSPVREWIYMLDVCKIIKNIIDNSFFNLPNPINLAQKNGITINELVNIIKKTLNYDVKLIHDTSKQDGAPIKILDNDQFKKYFFDFKFTEFNKGVEDTINYYKKLL